MRDTKYICILKRSLWIQPLPTPKQATFAFGQIEQDLKENIFKYTKDSMYFKN